MAINLHNIIAVLFRPLLFIVYYLAGFWPRNSRRWVFGSWSGMRFADNTAALFEYAAGCCLGEKAAMQEVGMLDQKS